MTDAPHSPQTRPDAQTDVTVCVPLDDAGLLLASGADARSFLHAQLTSDVQNLGPGEARLAGWCSAKGRLLATLLVISTGENHFLLQLSQSLVAAVAKRLGMFVLRAKAKIEDVGTQWVQFGILGPDASAALVRAGLEAPAAPLACTHAGDGTIAVRVDEDRFLVMVDAARADAFCARLALPAAPALRWRMEDIRAGRPGVVAATQDLFVPQMVNLQLVGGVDFRKGCYPGQEVVARTQYRGQLKRRMVRARLPALAEVQPGQDLFGEDGQPAGTVVNVVCGGEGIELLAVLPIGVLETGTPIRIAPGGPAIEILPLPYAA